MRIRMMLLHLILMGCSMNPCHAIQSNSYQDWRELSIFSHTPFERAVRCIKYYEQLHSPHDYPYIGYGHRLQPGETFDYSMTEQQADSLLRKDLLRLCVMFRSYKKDSLLLATLSYNIGPYKLLGNSKHSKSALLRMLDNGIRNISEEYLKFSYYRDKQIPSLRRRRYNELLLLFFK